MDRLAYRSVLTIYGALAFCYDRSENIPLSVSPKSPFPPSDRAHILAQLYFKIYHNFGGNTSVGTQFYQHKLSNPFPECANTTNFQTLHMQLNLINHTCALHIKLTHINHTYFLFSTDKNSGLQGDWF